MGNPDPKAGELTIRPGNYLEAIGIVRYFKRGGPRNDFKATIEVPGHPTDHKVYLVGRFDNGHTLRRGEQVPIVKYVADPLMESYTLETMVKIRGEVLGRHHTDDTLVVRVHGTTSLNP